MDHALQIRTAQNVDLALAPAGLGARVAAWAVDLVVLVAYGVAVGFALAEAGGGQTAVVLLLVVPILVYHLAFEVLFEGRTPGKLALRLRVARLDGAQPTLGQYLLRWILRFLDVTMTSGSVAVVAIAATERSQRLGDLVAGTTVIRQRRRVRLGEVLYPAVGPDHVPTVPTADRLSDADVRTLRAVLVRLRLGRRAATSRRLAERAKEAVEAKLGLGPVAMPAEAFLRAVVRDHVFLLDRVGGLEVPGALSPTPRADGP